MGETFKKVMPLIKQSTQAATDGLNSEIILKVNGLTDKPIIQALYTASQAGVKITLIVRGICCLRPGIKNVSSNIRVISIVGRFLEHHRVYYFNFGDEEKLYCSSADIMERNLHHRIETMFPILDETCQKRIKQEILHNYLKDNCDAWELKQNGEYKRLTQGTHSAQTTLLEKFCGEE